MPSAQALVSGETRYPTRRGAAVLLWRRILAHRPLTNMPSCKMLSGHALYPQFIDLGRSRPEFASTMKFRLVYLLCLVHGGALVQDARLTPPFADGIEISCLGLCLHGPNPRAEPYVPLRLRPNLLGPTTPPDDFALDDVIGDHTTPGAVAYPPDPAQHGLDLAPVGLWQCCTSPSSPCSRRT